MKSKIDCLLIGFNEVDINSVEKEVKKIGIDSGAYRDLNLTFIQYNGKKYAFGDIYNQIQKTHNANYTPDDFLHMGNSFCLSIAYLGTYLHRRNISFEYINSFQQEKDKLIDILLSNDILTIAVTTTFYTIHYPILEIVSFIKKYNDTATIIVGGPFVSNKIKENPLSSLGYFKIIGADIYVNSSQGEETLVNIINCLKNKDSLEKVNNIYYKENGSFALTPLKIENNDLGENMVDWSLFKSDYLTELTNVRSSISCPFSCSFCGFPERAGKYYTASVEALEGELNTLADTDIKSIFIIDDTFNVPKTRFKNILKMMIRNKYPFKWNSYFRCQFADRETIELMVEAGCEGVSLGIESANQTVLNNMNKNARVEDFKRGIKLLNEYNILSGATFIFGFPGETDESIQETTNFIEEYSPSYYSLLLWFCDPITSIFKEKDKFGIAGSQFEWAHNSMDFKTASNYIEEKFLKIKNSLFVRMAPLESQAIYTLKHRGFNIKKINNIIKSYNTALSEKVSDPAKIDCDISELAYQNLCKAIIE